MSSKEPRAKRLGEKANTGVGAGVVDYTGLYFVPKSSK